MGRPVPYGTTAHPHGARWAGRRVMRGRGVAPWGRPCRFDGVMLPVTRRDRAGPPAPHASVGRGGLGRWDCGCSLPSRRSRPFRGGPNAYVYGTAFASEERIGPIKGGGRDFCSKRVRVYSTVRALRPVSSERRRRRRGSRYGHHGRRPRGSVGRGAESSWSARGIEDGHRPCYGRCRSLRRLFRVHEVTGLQSTRYAS